MNPEAYVEMAETESRHWWFCGRRQILTETLSNLRLPKHARILEIGSGTGGNLPMLAQFGEVSALEMDSAARALASQKTGNAFDIRAGYCPDNVPFYGEQFDLICLFDVLEHIHDDQATLAALPELLRPDGHVILTVPAYRWLWGAHDEYLHHQRRYSATELKEKLAIAGFHVVRFSYFNTLLFPLAALIRLKERILGIQRASGSAVPAEPLNSLLKYIFAFERRILSVTSLPFGVSMMAVLKLRKS